MHVATTPVGQVLTDVRIQVKVLFLEDIIEKMRQAADRMLGCGHFVFPIVLNARPCGFEVGGTSEVGPSAGIK